MVSPAAIQKVVVAYFAATRTMDVEAWMDTFAEDAISYDPVGGPPFEGHRGLREYYQTISAFLDKIGITEDRVFIAGNGAAVKWTGHGVGKNGRPVAFEGIDVFEINDQGKIQKKWGYWNPTSLINEVLT